MFIHTKDPHPGRCLNHRTILDEAGYPHSVRCLNYEHTQHICKFPKVTVDVPQHTHTWTITEPVQWVAPND